MMDLTVYLWPRTAGCPQTHRARGSEMITSVGQTQVHSAGHLYQCLERSGDPGAVKNTLILLVHLSRSITHTHTHSLDFLMA